MSLIFPFDPNIARASTIPARLYTDPVFLALEEEKVFGRTWQIVARREAVAESGQFVTAEMGREAIVVLNDRGALRGFHNICLHRAGPVAHGCGKWQTLQCRYHGWTYALDGQLLHAPEMDRTDGFRAEPLSCRDDNSSVTASEVEHPVALLDDGGFKHPVNDFLGRGDVGGQIVRQLGVSGHRGPDCYRDRHQVRDSPSCHCCKSPGLNELTARAFVWFPVVEPGLTNAVAALPRSRVLTMRPTISVMANQRSLGRLMVYSCPLKNFTACEIESRQGICAGERL